VSIVDREVTVKDTWQAMEKLVDSGKVRSIGVSNFCVKDLEELLEYAQILPAINQVELHPYLAQNKLLEFCKSKGITVTAYSPLGSKPAPGTVLFDPVVAEIAKKHNKSPAQVLISWALQRDTVVIPKSVNPQRIVENFDVSCELTKEDMLALNKLDKGKRYVDPTEWWKVDTLFRN
jgi:diketogulonate reductase-like aldo/keto reductase